MSLIAQGLGRTYDGRVALESVSFRLEPGTVLGLLGPNGAGKTTLVRVLTTILEPTKGAFVVGVPLGLAAILASRLFSRRNAR